MRRRARTAVLLALPLVRPWVVAWAGPKKSIKSQRSLAIFFFLGDAICDCEAMCGIVDLLAALAW